MTLAPQTYLFRLAKKGENKTGTILSLYAVVNESIRMENSLMIRSIPQNACGTSNKRPKGPHIVHLSIMCHPFEDSAKVDICLLISPKNTDLVEDFEILLPVKFC